MRFLFFVLLVACVPPIYQDEFNVERKDEAKIDTEFGQIHARIFFQFDSIQNTFSAEDMAYTLYAVMQCINDEFGLPEELAQQFSDMTMFVTREHSSLFHTGCNDPVGDLFQCYACSLDDLYPHAGEQWQILTRESIYHSNDLVTLTHEMAHGYLWYLIPMDSSPGAWDRGDRNHVAPGIWETEYPSVVWCATEKAQDFIDSIHH